MWLQFLLQRPRVRPYWNLRQFLLSHIGKKASLFAPYKAWTNGWRVPLVWSFYLSYQSLFYYSPSKKKKKKSLFYYSFNMQLLYSAITFISWLTLVLISISIYRHYFYCTFILCHGHHFPSISTYVVVTLYYHMAIDVA